MYSSMVLGHSVAEAAERKGIGRCDTFGLWRWEWMGRWET